MIKKVMQKSWQLFARKASKVLLLLAIVAAACISGAAFHQDPIQKSHWTIGLEGVAYATTPDVTVDGDNDDADVQSVLNSLPSSGGSITLFAGVWDFDATVTRAVDNITIYGTGSGTQIITDGAFEPFDCTGQDYWKFADFACDQAPTYDSSGGYPVSTIIDGLWIAGTFTVEYPAGTLSSVNGSRSVTLVVAGSNASSDVQASADYTCDGAADQVQINAAITALTSGRTSIETVKCIGDFNLNDGIIFSSYTRLDLTEAQIDWNTAYVAEGDSLFSATGAVVAAAPAPQALTANGDKGDAQITVGTTANFAVGDYVLIRSEAQAYSTHYDGEIHRIATIDGGGTMTLDAALWRTYLMADTATAQKLNMKTDIEIIGGNITGTSATQDANIYGVDFRFVGRFKVQNMRWEKISDRSMWFVSCVDGEISGNKIWGSARTGLGYGIDVSCASNTLLLHHNDVRYCRHALAGGVWNSGSYKYGAPTFCTWDSNYCEGGAAGESCQIVDMHDCDARGLLYSNNTVVAPEDSGYDGFAIGAADFTCIGNIVSVPDYHFRPRNADSNKYITLIDNEIWGTGEAMNFSICTAIVSVTVDGVEAHSANTGTDSWIVFDTGVAASYASISNVRGWLGGSGLNNGVFLDGFGTVSVRDCDLRGFQNYGVQVAGAESGIIEGIITANNGDAGIYISASTYLFIHGNYCYDDQGAPTQNYGIQEAGASDYNIAANNRCWGNITDNVTIIGAHSSELDNY